MDIFFGLTKFSNKNIYDQLNFLALYFDHKLYNLDINPCSEPRGKPMKKILSLSLSCIALSACVTSASPEANQSAITNAAMMSDNASCQQIAHNIETMDQIIVDTGMQNSSANNYATQNAINSGLYQSGLYQKAPYLSSIPGLANSFGNSQPTQLERQQGNEALREKNRLINLFKQKKCVRTN